MGLLPLPVSLLLFVVIVALVLASYFSIGNRSVPVWTPTCNTHEEYLKEVAEFDARAFEGAFADSEDLDALGGYAWHLAQDSRGGNKKVIPFEGTMNNFGVEYLFQNCGGIRCGRSLWATEDRVDEVMAGEVHWTFATSTGAACFLRAIQNHPDESNLVDYFIQPCNSSSVSAGRMSLVFKGSMTPWEAKQRFADRQAELLPSKPVETEGVAFSFLSGRTVVKFVLMSPKPGKPSKMPKLLKEGTKIARSIYAKVRESRYGDPADEPGTRSDQSSHCVWECGWCQGTRHRQDPGVRQMQRPAGRPRPRPR